MEKVYTIILFDSALNAKVHVNVSKDVFDEYRRGIWRIRKNNSKHLMISTVFSELKEIEEDTYEKFHEFIDHDANPENILADKTKKEKLREVILSLKPKEQKLIKALFFDGVEEKDYANSIGKTPKQIYKRKYRILKKIKNILEKRG